MFVTPLDREDIHVLASHLDDVMDVIDATAAVIRLYKIQVVRPVRGDSLKSSSSRSIESCRPWPRLTARWRAGARAADQAARA